MSDQSVATPTAAATTPNVATDTAGNPAEQPTQVDKTIKYKYNHEEQVLDLSKPEDMERAAEYLREGRYFLEKGKGKLAELESDEGFKWMRDVAKEYGVTPADLAKKWGAEIKGKIVNDYAEANDITPEKAEKELKNSAEFKELKDELDGLKKRLAVDDEVKALFKDHPNLTADKIPAEVLERAKTGEVTLSQAYKEWEDKQKDARIAELEKQLSVKNTNDTNAESSMGKVDPAEFEGELTEEIVRNMTREQRQKNMPKILEAMARGFKKK